MIRILSLSTFWQRIAIGLIHDEILAAELRYMWPWLALLILAGLQNSQKPPRNGTLGFDYHVLYQIRCGFHDVINPDIELSPRVPSITTLSKRSGTYSHPGSHVSGGSCCSSTKQ